LNLTIGEVNRLARFISKNERGLIDYSKFLASLDIEMINLALSSTNTLNQDNLFTLQKMADWLANYL
jgi:hypothetical protein